MLNFLVNHSLRNLSWALITTVVIIAAGSFAASQLNVDATPDITNVQVVVNTKTGALDPEQIEQSVTFPVETAMAGISGITEVRSLSKYGLSQVTLVFEDGTDLYKARQQVSERLQNVRGDLPEFVKAELGPVTTGLGEVFMYGVRAKAGTALAQKPELDRLIYLRTIQEYMIRPEMKKINGAADVDSNGGYLKEIHINLDIARLNHFGISIENLALKLDSLGKNSGGGYIQHKKKQLIVRTYGRIDTLESIRQIPIKMNALGQSIQLRDVADVRVENSPRLGAATYNGEEVVLGTVLMRVGANSRQVANLAQEKLKSIALPPDVEVVMLYTRSFLVNATIQTVLKNLLEGALLVILVLVLILNHVRAAILVSLAIPLSMLAAFIGMKFFNISANLMSLGAIDFGLLVDASIVMVENYLHKLESAQAGPLDRAHRLELFMESAREVVKPVTIGLIIIMAVYVPILSLDGIEGKMFQPMAITVLMALGASLFIAIMLIPPFSLYVIQGKSLSTKPWLFRVVEKFYHKLLLLSMKKRFKTLLITSGILLLFVSAVLFLRLGSDFVPQLDEGDLVIGLVRSTDIAIDESVHVQKMSEKIILKFPEVEHVFSRLGTSESATDPMGVNFADTFVILKKDLNLWPKVNGERRTKSELYEAIAALLKKETGDQEISDTQPIEMRFNEILEGSRADVTMRIFGPDLDKLMEIVSKAEEILAKLPGTSSVEMDALTALKKSPVLDIKIDYNKLLYYDIDLQNVNRILQMAMGGYQVGTFIEDAWHFPIIMHLDERLRNHIHQIASIPVQLPDGGSVPLQSVSRLEIHNQVTTIARSFSNRYAAISIYIKNQDVSTFVADAQEKINRLLSLPAGYRIEWGGQFKNLEKARSMLMIVVPLILLGILFLLLRTFNSFLESFLIYLSIPFAMTGGVFSLYLRDIHFSVSAAIGFIALSGIAILNGMVLINKINQLLEEGMSIQEAAINGAMARLRPVLMTALVASLGFFPMAINSGLGSEVQRPLATVVIGGLVTSTVLTLLLIPVIFTLLKTRRR